MSARDRMTPEQRAALAQQLGDAQPARTELLASFGESVQNRAEHDHTTQREDWYCLNLAAYMGERMAPVLRRLIDAEAEIERYRERYGRIEVWTCHVCSARTDTDPCHVCETDRPDAEQGEKDTAPAATSTPQPVYVFNRRSVNRTTKHIASPDQPERTLCGLESSTPKDRPAVGDTLHLCRLCREHKGGDAR